MALDPRSPMGVRWAPPRHEEGVDHAGRAAGPAHGRYVIEAVRRAEEAVAHRDIDAIMATLTEDILWETTSPPDGERHTGKAAVRRAMEEFISSSVFETEELVALGDQAFWTWVNRWTNGDGKQGHVRGVDIVRVRDGKVAEMPSYVKG